MECVDLISVIVPVYKAEKYIKKCLESLINQTYKNLEIILIDDGSPDASGMICDEYAKTDSRIKVIHKQNAGVSSARNIGMQTATGKYITFVDSDDWVECDAYEKMVNKIKENDVDFIRCGFYKDDADGVKEKDYIYPNSIKLNLEEKRNELLNLFITGKIDAGICYLLIKREFIERIDRFDESVALGEDLIFEIELVCVAGSMYMYNERFYHYTTNEESATKSAEYMKRNISNFLFMYEGIYNVLEKHHLLNDENREVFAFNRFYNIYLKLSKYVAETNDKDIIKSINNNPKTTFLLNNINITNMSIIAKIFYFLIKHKRNYLLYLFCLLFNTLKSRKENKNNRWI